MGRRRTGAGLTLAALCAAGCAGVSGEAERSTIRVYTVAECLPMSWPVDAVVSSGFGMRDGRRHDGIDLAVPEGTLVRAACDGVVVVAGRPLAGYGNLVMLRHAGPLVTVYAHNQGLLVRAGERVARGQVIARSGQTGRATAPHLHFEVRRDTRARDPLEYLDDRRSTRLAQGENPRRAGLPEAGNPVQGRDAPHRPRPILPPVH